MFDVGILLFISFFYMGILFALAYFGDRSADIGQSIISNPYIYALSLAVYCTAWTFYGSVGRAANTGPGFLTIYIGPTLMSAVGWLILRKIIRICKMHRITSIADFVSSRYGKSAVLGGTVTVIAVLGIVPYISLQLKAISTSFLILKHYPEIAMPEHFYTIPVSKDTAFYVAMILTLFAILFGTRHLETTERHEGLVAAIAFESIVKLIAFLAVGIFVTYGLFDGFGDVARKAMADPELKALFTMSDRPGTYLDWAVYIFLSMMAVTFLPRQFQLTVVENVNEDHLSKAMWLFPLYLLAINIFVLPVAVGGSIHFPDGSVDPDTFVLTLPMKEKHITLALLVYIGGMSAATGMVIVEAIALSTMICNDLVMPILLRLPFLQLARRSDLSGLFLIIRRASIAFVLLLGYAYFRFIGEFYPLVSIGLVSFAAVAQFAPSILGGIFWKDGTHAGALSGLVAGFLIWMYTLVFPSLVQVGLLPERFVTEGPFGVSLLKPFQLFGLTGFDHVSHAVFWSLFANVFLYINVSLITRPTPIEQTQAAFFVDVFKHTDDISESPVWRATAPLPDLRSLLTRFLGRQRAEDAFATYAQKHNIIWDQAFVADSELVGYAEKLLAGAIGSASARVMVASVVEEEPLGIEDVMGIIDETSQVITYSRELEQKSRELERATAELKAANERLKELDKLKDEFISTVTHELRTPLTSVRSIAEIMYEYPDLEESQSKKFASIIIKESERLTRLISQVLDFQKIESGRIEWQIGRIDMAELITETAQTFNQLVQEKKIQLNLHLPDKVPMVEGDRDRITQALINLISNAVKFCESGAGRIDVALTARKDHIQVDVKDNGIGISPENQEIVFAKFRQIKDGARGRPSGSGLGLTITRRIIELHQGKIWVESDPGQGAVFSFILPLTQRSDMERTSLGF